MNEITFDKKSEKMKVFSLHPKTHSYNAYFENEYVFCAFNFKFVDEPNLQDKYNGFMFDISEYIGLYQSNFEEEIEKGDVLIFSKVEGRIVEKVICEGRGATLPTVGKTSQFHDYFLPNGMKFLNFMNFHVNYNFDRKEDNSFRQFLARLLP